MQARDDIATGKRRGSANYKDEAKIAAAWDIVYDVQHKWTQTEKNTKLNAGDYLNKGVPGDVFGQMLAEVEKFEHNDERKEYMVPIEAYFGDQRAILVQNKAGVDEIRKIDMEEFVSKKALADFMRNNPDDKEAWGRKVEELMAGSTMKDINAMVEQQLGGKYPGVFQKRLSEEEKLDIAREQLGTIVTTSPELMPKLVTAYPKIREREISILWWSGIKDVEVRQTKSGDFNYKAKDGTIYKVSGAADEEGRIRNMIFKWNVANATWVPWK